MDKEAHNAKVREHLNTLKVWLGKAHVALDETQGAVEVFVEKAHKVLDVYEVNLDREAERRGYGENPVPQKTVEDFLNDLFKPEGWGGSTDEV